MMYTKGIRKIYTSHTPAHKLHMIQAMAEGAGYDALAFNGYIFIRILSEDFTGWVNSCFRVTDFSDEQE